MPDSEPATDPAPAAGAGAEAEAEADTDPHTHRRAAPELYVLKRLFVEKGERVRMSGLREIHFGLKLQGQAHIGMWWWRDTRFGLLWGCVCEVLCFDDVMC